MNCATRHFNSLLGRSILLSRCQPFILSLTPSSSSSPSTLTSRTTLPTSVIQTKFKSSLCKTQQSDTNTLLVSSRIIQTASRHSMTASMSSSIESQDYFVVEQVHADGEIPVTLYQNKITGLRVVTANIECPIVKGDLVFATEAFDDDGLPHTLEHLVFLGSEDYPYKGVLDLLANRSLASGTNAYTDTDHTNYTVCTAGADGFLNLLPIYLDHVLFPILTESAYDTEVHHINGEGEDAGVVYCEMQARENSGDSRCYLEMLRSMYPGKCGYKSETGGLLHNLRTSTSNEKVRDYHKQFYHAKNLCVVVTGPVEAADVFKAIKPIEDKIVQKGIHKMDFERPWQTKVEPLDKSVQRRLQYSSDTDDDGLVYIGFRGPNVVENFKELIAITILLDYLNSTAISPLQRDFVECDDPFCSSVSHNIIENSTSLFYLSFESVGKQYLDSVAQKLFDLLKCIQSGKEELDMERLQTVISRKKVRILSCAETSPHSIVVGPVIGHFLYGTGQLRERAQEIPILEEFVKCQSSFWLNLIDRYMTGREARHVVIVGEPSPEMMEQMSSAEKKRLADQKERLKDQLKSIGDKLQESIDFNERPAPQSMLSSVDVPSAENIKFHPIERLVLDPKLGVPFRVQYDSIKTNFVTINVLMNTSKSLTKTDRLYLPILTEIILECPIDRNGELVPYEKIVAELFSDTISIGAGIGLSSSATYSVGQFSMMLGIMMQVELDKYERAVEWIRELLYKTVFTPERIKTVATRLVSDISQHKRSGGKVLSSCMNSLAYQSNSNHWATNFMRQQKFLKQLLKDLKSGPELVKQNFTRIRDTLTQTNNILVHISMNKNKLDASKLHEPWLNMVPAEVVDSSPKEFINFADIVPCCQLIEYVPSPKAAIVGVGSVESNYMQQIVKSINSLDHPDLAAVFVLTQYLTQLEGPLWRQIRGLGLSYSYSIQLSPSDGLMYFTLYKSSQLMGAYNKTIEIVNRYFSGEEDFEDNLFEAAKSSLIFEFIKREKSAAGKSIQSLVAYLRNLDIDFNKELIKRVARVTKDDLRRVGPLHLKPLFEDVERRTVVCCHPNKLDEITMAFSEINMSLQRMSLESESFWNSLASKNVQAAWPRTKMRLDQIGLELSLESNQTPPISSDGGPGSGTGSSSSGGNQPNKGNSSGGSGTTGGASQTMSSVNKRLSSEFEKNKFYVNPNEPPITTDLQPEEVFEELETLGTGSGGSVLKMRHKPSGKICAVKQMRRTLNEEENKRIYMDLQVVLQCECDNIVRCCGYFIKEAEVWVCMELMTTCFDKLLRTRRPLPEKFLGAIAASALKALYYLKEKHNIIHRDVKPSNILINDQGQIKLCDFGISGRLIDSLAKTRSAGCIPYMAPERIDLSNSSYDIRADVWSLGVTLYELATGKSPYANCNTDFNILLNIVNEPPPVLPSDMEFSQELRDFLAACLTKDVKQRPKYKQLMEFEFIKRHNNTVVSLSELDDCPKV